MCWYAPASGLSVLTIPSISEGTRVAPDKLPKLMAWLS